MDDDFEGFEFDDRDPHGLDDHESALVRQDLTDLDRFYRTFSAEGYRGVSVYCHDCAEEHFYEWDMLRENLEVLLDTGETPVHEPAFQPDPEKYVPWEYARGYVDALQDAGVDIRRDAGTCPRCHLALDGQLRQGNYCPRCGTPLLMARLVGALRAHGLSDQQVDQVLREAGLPG